MKINDMDIVIEKNYYNKTIVGEDGITHTVDTEHEYPLYQFGMGKNYFDIEDKGEVVDQIIKDLKEVIRQLEAVRQKETNKDKER